MHRTPTRMLRIAIVGLVVGVLLAVQMPTAQAATPRLPVGAMTSATQWARGVVLTGWAIDPDTKAAVVIDVVVAGRLRATKPAADASTLISRTYAAWGPNHGITVHVHLKSGTYRACFVAHNVGSGAATRTIGCKTVTLADSPFGHLNSVTPVAGGFRARGWAIDYDAIRTPLKITITADGQLVRETYASERRDDLATFAQYAIMHGFDVTVPLANGPHTICVTAVNLGAGASLHWPCRQLSVANVRPRAPTGVTARLGRTSVTVAWKAPTANGGTPITSYSVKSFDGTLTAKVAATGRSTVFAKLVPRRHYTFVVYATNRAGTSVASAPSNTVVGPPPIIGPVTTPALVSTSRYIRNIHGRAGDTTTTRRMGATDASYNPSNHRYLVLLDIGGQTTTRIGLSATSIYITYAQLVTALKAYVDGYASTQKYNAPVIIALGVNNDIDVRWTTGKIWATKVVNPMVAYVRAKHYPNMAIAGADDMEPGFIGTPAQTKSWLRGYLAYTRAKFVFNGSADGCNWTKVWGRCNNHWTANDLQYLAGGVAPTRILSLPQIYNTTMAKQWKYISLTGIVGGQPKINFAGPLTEWTACYPQHGQCSSLTNNQAWTALWAQLRSDRRISQASLTYGTDLRIN
ncbi:MAG TPA: fibronectin type III domain-containing protein [Mycobacterium sp.]|nr:fibronectin type III domain-containing protein [Mycobacterium sp.]